MKSEQASERIFYLLNIKIIIISSDVIFRSIDRM